MMNFLEPGFMRLLIAALIILVSAYGAERIVEVIVDRRARNDS